MRLGGVAWDWVRARMLTSSVVTGFQSWNPQMSSSAISKTLEI
jgi:hypothetical protein